MRANYLVVVVLALCVVSAQVVFASRTSQRHIKLLSANVQTDVQPQFNSDVAYASYLSGGKDKWKKVIASSSQQNKNSELQHSYLLHFKNNDYVSSKEKIEVELAINQIGGCHSKDSGTFSFDRDAKYYAFNSYLVHCSEPTVTTLKAQFHHVLWIGSWLPAYKYHKLKSEEKVRISLIGVTSDSEAWELSFNLQKELAETLKITINILLAKSDTIIFTTSVDDTASLKQLYSFLSHQTFVHYITDVPKMTFLNQNAAWVLQDDVQDDYTIYDEGLLGDGQIIGVTDTGLDYDNCFFWDPNVPMPLNTTNHNHRKVVGYHTLGGCEFGDLDGHGTHTAGSIAGNAVGSGQNSTITNAIHIGTGNAPNAKLSVIGFASPSGELILPDDLNDFFILPYDDGAKIISNSWGCYSPDPTQCNVYDPTAYQVDEFVRNHEDVLIIFSAGNSGRDTTQNGSFTVVSPGISKNVLTVGASSSAIVSFQTISYYSDPVPYFGFYCNQPVCGGICTNCSDSIQNCCNNNLTMCCPSQIAQFYSDALIYNQSNLADFSSRGPADFTPSKDSLRVKPDVVAPGQFVVSAHSDANLNTYQCSPESPFGDNAAALKSLRGTSMSAPVIAGNAALIRQYFAEGNYDYHGIGAGRSATSDVVKALLIASADPLTGVYKNSATLEWLPAERNTPNFIEGWGKPKLGNIIKTSIFDPSLFIYRDSLFNQSSVNFNFNAEAGTAFKAILVWNDVPGTPGSAHPLVNNLDLIVTDPSSGVHYGNEYLTSNTPDVQNNVESFTAIASAGVYNVEVKATNIAVGSTQSYALVVVGGAEVASPTSSPSIRASISVSTNPIPPNKSQMLKCRKRCSKKCKRKLTKRGRLTPKKLKACVNKCVVKICF